MSIGLVHQHIDGHAGVTERNLSTKLPILVPKVHIVPLRVMVVITFLAQDKAQSCPAREQLTQRNLHTILNSRGEIQFLLANTALRIQR